MHAMQRSMRRAVDRAADKSAAKFVSERLPPMWLEDSIETTGGASKAAKVDLRHAYDTGDGSNVAAGLRCGYVMTKVVLLAPLLWLGSTVLPLRPRPLEC